MTLRTFLIVAGLALFPGVAFADPCEAPLPRQAGQTFAGTVRYVGDGDSLCVGQSRNPNTWIEVRLADFNAPELHSAEGPRAKAALERIALNHIAQCVAGGGRNGRVTSYDRVIATCRINGRRIGDLMRAAQVQEGGR
jgi:endonuclease YncB( thermonuclease family)